MYFLIAYNVKNKYCMKEQIIKIIESKAQGKYHLEIDESDLEVIANEILKLFDVMVLFKPNELWRMAQKYKCDDFIQMIEQSKRLNKL